MGNKEVSDSSLVQSLIGSIPAGQRTLSASGINNTYRA